jgi:iron(III) transport system ATP-binding protein
MSRIRIQNLGKVYGQQAALAGIDLNIADGALLALLGPSGCGKSTTLQLLAGFEEPTSGEIWADDQLLSSPRGIVSPERRGVSLVFQNYAVWPHKTVAENVAFGLKLQKLGTAEFKKRLDEALGTVQLTALRDRYPAELSGGQQQRVALARALAVRPRASCCSTSRCRTWMRTCARRCDSRSAASTTCSASRPCWSRTTRPMRFRPRTRSR